LVEEEVTKLKVRQDKVAARKQLSASKLETEKLQMETK
jgi:hypothetical protein